MFAGSGKYLGWAVGLLVVSVVIFLFSVNGPHLRAGPGASKIDPVAIISTITGLIGALATLVTALDKYRGGGTEKTNTTSVGGTDTRPPQVDDFPDYETPKFAPPARRYRRGDLVEFVRTDRRDDRYNLVEVRRFVQYDRDGYEVWTVIDKYREYRT
jgi:hypothetical protein